jgi:hypothetical protein
VELQPKTVNHQLAGKFTPVHQQSDCLSQAPPSANGTPPYDGKSRAVHFCDRAACFFPKTGVIAKISGSKK